MLHELACEEADDVTCNNYVRAEIAVLDATILNPAHDALTRCTVAVAGWSFFWESVELYRAGSAFECIVSAHSTEKLEDVLSWRLCKAPGFVKQLDSAYYPLSWSWWCTDKMHSTAGVINFWKIVELYRAGSAFEYPLCSRRWEGSGRASQRLCKAPGFC